jgi:hypothetical protein
MWLSAFTNSVLIIHSTMYAKRGLKSTTRQVQVAALHPLGIYQVSKRNTLINPLKSVRNPPASTCCLCWTAVAWKYDTLTYGILFWPSLPCNDVTWRQNNLWERAVWLYHIFPHYLTNCTIVGEKVIEHKCIFIISTTLRHFSFYEGFSEILP